MGNSVSPRFTGAVLVTIVLAFLLLLLPLPELWMLWRPEWIALTFIYWSLKLPKKISLVVAWIAGLFVDVFYGSILGQHALGLVIVVFMSLRLMPRLSVTILWHQIILVFLVLGTYLLVNLWIMAATGSNPATWQYWLPLLSSLIIWPLYSWVMSFFHIERSRFDVF
ncbi:MAG: rod shape-determining protein MreD [Cocleimonas sp.]|nr:rod shape-determining protein MreD [Cocleimonas sp.]